MSLSKNSRMSGMPYRSIAIRSGPMPHANPVYFSLSTLQFSSTAGCTMPEPRISIQPVPLQAAQPEPPPPQIWHCTSISADGSAIVLPLHRAVGGDGRAVPDLQAAQPEPPPPQIWHCTSISADGSVKGKYDGRNRTLVVGEKMRRANAASIDLRSTNVSPSSTPSPSICSNTGECEASNGSRR